MGCLELIADYYGDRRAKRSGVLYMNHITEGLVVMNRLGAGKAAKDAYCVHPIFQDDETLLENGMRQRREPWASLLGAGPFNVGKETKSQIWGFKWLP